SQEKGVQYVFGEGKQKKELKDVMSDASSEIVGIFGNKLPVSELGRSVGQYGIGNGSKLAGDIAEGFVESLYSGIIDGANKTDVGRYLDNKIPKPSPQIPAAIKKQPDPVAPISTAHNTRATGSRFK